MAVWLYNVHVSVLILQKWNPEYIKMWDKGIGVGKGKCALRTAVVTVHETGSIRDSNYTNRHI